MRVGLLRHFRVTEPWPTGWVTSDDLQRWRIRYDAAEPIISPVDVSAVNWQRCLSSDLKRAAITARAAYSGAITETPLLREVETAPFGTGSLRLPVWGWRMLYRLAWWTGHSSQRAVRDTFRQRIHQLGDNLERADQDTLVVSHAGVMYYLRHDLLRRGFSGPEFQLAQHARLYVFESAATGRSPN